MNSRDLRTFLVLEFLGFAVAGAVFSIFESRLLAGSLAGGFFILSGLFMLARAWKWQDRWTAFCWYPLLLHVFVISIPMVTVRWMNADVPFDELHVLGIPGPVFHRLSSLIFTGLVLATGLDWWRVRRARESRPANTQSRIIRS